MNTKKWYESRTVWIAVAQGVAGIVAAIFAADPAIKTTGAGLVLKSLYDIYLRLTTVSEIV